MCDMYVSVSSFFSLQGLMKPCVFCSHKNALEGCSIARRAEHWSPKRGVWCFVSKNVLAYAEKRQEVSTDLGLLQRDNDQWHRAALEVVGHLPLSPFREEHYKLNKENGAAMQQYPRYVLREVREG